MKKRHLAKIKPMILNGMLTARRMVKGKMGTKIRNRPAGRHSTAAVEVIVATARVADLEVRTGNKTVHQVLGRIAGGITLHRLHGIRTKVTDMMVRHLHGPNSKPQILKDDNVLAAEK